MNKLWYKQPASNWNEALPVGNGRIGAMLFGGTGEDIYMLNDDTLWSGYPADTNNYAAAVYFRKAAELAMDKRYREAQSMIEEHMLGKWGQGYLPAGDLVMKTELANYAEYTRTLDIGSAVHTVRFVSDGVTYERETFVTAADRVLCIAYRADNPGSISFSLSLRGQLRPGVEADGDTVTLTGEAPGELLPDYVNLESHARYSEIACQRGMTYCIMASVSHQGGSLRTENGALIVLGADAAEIRVAVNTSFTGFDKHPFLQGKDPSACCREQLSGTSPFSYEELKARHIADYRRYFDRMEMDLGGGRDDLPTDERLRLFAETQDDNGLQALFFQFGRYLLLSSSRPGTQPANLQGIWNPHLCAPWRSNYTTNINTQMNYWPALPCNLAECAEPLYKMVGELRVTGKMTAMAHYGAQGFCAHHNVDLWRHSSPVGNGEPGSAIYAFYPLAGAWLTRHLWEHYEYTLDRDFIRDAYPTIRESAQFCDSILSEMPDGSLAVSPATSPENEFYYENRVSPIAAASTHTLAVTDDAFRIFLCASEILGTDRDYASHIQKRLAGLRRYPIGSKGQLLEWDEEYEECDPHHRHASHLYLLHPADIANKEDTPELLEACKKSLELRGDDGTGWSIAWKINFWARLQDGDHALSLLSRQLRFVDASRPEAYTGGGTYPNLLDAHPPFQIDGNFGASAGIAEMLLQSRPGIVTILPALPGKWQHGFVRGLRARGGLTVDIRWAEGKLRTLTLHFSHPVSLALRYGEKCITVAAEPGDSLEFDENFAVIR